MTMTSKLFRYSTPFATNRDIASSDYSAGDRLDQMMVGLPEQLSPGSLQLHRPIVISSHLERREVLELGCSQASYGRQGHEGERPLSD
jgi:hypothetical protein